MYTGVLPAFMPVHMCTAQGSQKRELDFPGVTGDC